MSEPTKSIEDILKDTSPGRETSGKAKQYIKSGSYDDAIQDFNDVGTVGIKNIVGKEGKVGTLPDGRSINVRLESSDRRPTLEIQPLGGKGSVIKIRYKNS